MVRAGSSPGGRQPGSVSLWLIPPAVTALCAVLAVIGVPDGARAPAAWCGAVATLAVGLASAEVVRRGRVIATLRQRHAGQEAALRQRLVEQETETVRLADDLLPAAVERLQRGATVEEVLAAVGYQPGIDPQFRTAHQAVLRSVMEAVRAEEDLRDSAQRAFVNIARRVQAIVHQQGQDLREMEDRHGNTPEVFGDLLHLDHGTALIGRLADSIAVLGGSRPGRQWQQNVPLFNVARGAMSRILDYQRVDLHSVAEVAIVGPAVEPLIHALAELLDNATRYSPPQTRVHLTAVEVQSGVALEIEDAGVGLTEEARRRAERVLAQASAGIDLNDLGETPRLGLAVVGRLSQAHDFQVSLRPSAYGGVRSVLIVPQDLITATPTPGGTVAKGATLPPAKPRKRPAPMPLARQNGSPLSMDASGPVTRGSNGLPQRRRRNSGVAPVPGTAPSPTASVAPPRPPAAAEQVKPGLWLAAFQSGVNGEKPITGATRPHTEEALDRDE
ncbi:MULTISPECIES: sensor histidine kinase KdpD [Streptomyces]|uniref:histidine kinase n=1 Tax=Streptomyces lycii TaxID=2654337 RepID=A0ABQ7FRY0_9ACTN|nr:MULTISPECIES: ATP-binding protein [Streptomyces]KAF4410811.1 sensor histidine kinase [Streptomyces lycii]PGH51022.1 ATP-binding protein [Streptomyces sp. Ru87]